MREKLHLISPVLWLVVPSLVGICIGVGLSWLLVVRGTAAPIMPVVQAVVDSAVTSETWKGLRECERSQAIFYGKMNRCLGELSTACFDPEYCERRRAAAANATLEETD